MESIASQAIDGFFREGFSVSELASEIEKSVKFASWQTKIFSSGERAVENLQKYEQKAFQVFVNNLRATEKAAWNFVDADGDAPSPRFLRR